MMKKLYRKYLSAFIAIMLISPAMLFAGNKDRTGEAGASEILINPWGASSGWGNCNTASVRGIEGTFMNIAGTAFTKGTDVKFSYTFYVGQINLLTAGLSQQVGKTGVLSIYISNMAFGEIPIIHADDPDLPKGVYSPNSLNIGLAYAKVFSNSIYGGIQVKLINQSLYNLSATGVAFDVGIQYVTGKKDNLKFGITLKNWGPNMKFSGDGQSIRVNVSGKGENQFTLQIRSATYELPSQLLIGLSYDFITETEYRFTLAGTFISNAFAKDQIALGLEISLKEYLILRGGYTYEQGIFNFDTRTTLFSGPSCGLTVNIPVNKQTRNGFGLDYSYRFTNPFGGVHTVGVTVDF
ncbi:MAG: PorV/PorQ family protein [Bacteroidales bacterium]|jgi:hypothetical protein|nr:PorV/PorQ family protein [Bacteroidales bacterium]